MTCAAAQAVASLPERQPGRCITETWPYAKSSAALNMDGNVDHPIDKQ